MVVLNRSPLQTSPDRNTIRYQHWPARVAIMSYGKQLVYPGRPVICGEGQVRIPADLGEWASRRWPLLSYISWDLVDWLPCDDVRGLNVGDLTDEQCWSTVFGCKLFEEMIIAIKKRPCDLVMSEAQMRGEQSVNCPATCVSGQQFIVSASAEPCVRVAMR